MANTKSAKRAARVAVRRLDTNKSRRSRLKGTLRGVEEAITSGNKAAAETAMKAAEPMLIRSAQKGIVHKKTASRKVSRLTARIRTMSA